MAFNAWRASSSSGSLRFNAVSARAMQSVERRVVEPLQHEHLAARQQRAVQFERRILGGGADQHHGAVLDIGQEAVLLRPVEAVDLVDEEQRALAADAPLLRRVEHLAQIGDAREHRRKRLEMHVRRLGEEPRDRGLAAAGRAPQDHRRKPPLRHHAPDRPVGLQKMVLPHHLVEPLRPQPVCQGPWRILLEQAHRTVTVRSLPLRRTAIVQGALDAPSVSCKPATVSTGW